MTSAWIVHWQGTYDKENQKVIALFDPRKGSDFIEEFVLGFYMANEASSEDKLDHLSKRRKFPYPVEYDRINGAPWKARMYCGHNPFIVAELADNVEVVAGDNGEEKLTWEARPKPTAPAA